MERRRFLKILGLGTAAGMVAGRPVSEASRQAVKGWVEEKAEAPGRSVEEGSAPPRYLDSPEWFGTRPGMAIIDGHEFVLRMVQGPVLRQDFIDVTTWEDAAAGRQSSIPGLIDTTLKMSLALGRRDDVDEFLNGIGMETQKFTVWPRGREESVRWDFDGEIIGASVTDSEWGVFAEIDVRVLSSDGRISYS